MPVLIAIIFILYASIVSAQKIQPTPRIVNDGWIEKMSEYLGVKLALTNNVETFSVNTNADDFDIYPNTSTLARLSVNYRALSFSVAYAPKFFAGNDDDAIRGSTKSGGIGGGLSFSHWFTNFSYSRTKGYYLDNTSDYRQGWRTGDPYIQFPDLLVKSFEGYTGYNFNPRFSQTSLLTQTERQLKSAGAFIPRVSYRYYIVDNQAAGTTQKSNNFLLSVAAGYYHTFVIKSRFYISGGISPAFGYIFTRLLTRDPTGDIITHSNSPVFLWDGNVGIGYNVRRFFAGAYLSVFGSEYKQQHTTVINSNTRSAYQLFIGYRFLAPKFLRTDYDKVEKAIFK